MMILSYMAQDVVTHYNWLSAQEMIDGLALAEAIPNLASVHETGLQYINACRDSIFNTFYTIATNYVIQFYTHSLIS